ncbi:hypothetical protein L1987_37426 [Smallanthus sonchifolius]|uniref:Uncharacterized protein n=1 Tax=Smallanthus sonchifolius TaxID=185202 RepID=A0ACB9HIW9_9ASTR|nr:hypothetical protein L1987_37426 [Smallanthus sonchifolius]
MMSLFMCVSEVTRRTGIGIPIGSGTGSARRKSHLRSLLTLLLLPHHLLYELCHHCSTPMSRITKLTADLAATDTAHENLANGCVDMEDQLNTTEWNLDILHTRIEQVDARLAAVEAAGVAPEDVPEDAPAGDQDEDDDDAASDVTSIMSGRGNGRGGRAGGRGGRGNINMTAAELTALINERVAEAVAATHAAINAGVKATHYRL